PTVPPVLRRTFTLPASATGRPARLYASALGLYRARLNGSEVGGARLAPGWTDYAQRALYQAYDVGDLVAAGENALEVDLADGWYAGNVACVGRSVYGDRPAFIAELHYGLGGDDPGSVVTDESWTSTSGPRLAADLLKGEWHHAGGAQPQSASRPVETLTGPALAAQIAPEVGVVAEWEPVAMNTRPEVEGGSVLVDFGRNLAGVVRLQLGVTGAEAIDAAGSTGAVETRTISLRHAEMLDERGELYTSSLRGATQLDLLSVPAQHGAHTFEPSFTVHGFRYVELGGLAPGTAAALAAGPGADEQHDGCRAAVTALEIGSRFTKTGWFHSSHHGLNELVS